MTRRSVAPVLLSPLAAAAFPAPKLNHFYATVDAESYAAIEASNFLREQFAPFEKRTTVRNDGTYSGLYFYGTETYFEFFEAGKGGRKPGDAGLALGIETPGGSSALLAQWQKIQPGLTATVTRQLDGKPIDWFDMTSFAGDTRERSTVEGFRLFAMEYKPYFLRKWLASAPDSIRLTDVLAGYCEKLGLAEVRRTSMLDDVNFLHLSGPAPGLQLRARQLAAAGWPPNAPVRMTPAPTSIGYTRLEFRLKREQKSASIALGKTSLRIDGKRAVWTLVS